MNDAEIIAIIKAKAAGKPLEMRPKYGQDSWPWIPLDPGQPEVWDFRAIDYRVQREPEFFWINEYVGEMDRILCLYETEEEAEKAVASGRTRCFKVQEVIE